MTAEPGDVYKFEYPDEPQFNRTLQVVRITGYGPDDLVLFEDHSHSKQKNLTAAMKAPGKTGLFRHAAKLAQRAQDRGDTIFVFEATHLEVKLRTSSTSPFHNLSDGAVVYVEIGVDPSVPGAPASRDLDDPR
jgi:hypothetical protein